MAKIETGPRSMVRGAEQKCCGDFWLILRKRLVRTLKLAIVFSSVTLVLVACRQVESRNRSSTAEYPEKRSTAAEICEHIVGEWRFSEKSDGSWFPQIVIAPDGSFVGVHGDGTRELVGRWKLDHHILVVNTVKTNYAVFKNGQTVSLGTVEYFPVIFAGEHELVCTPGISVAGRYRFTK